MMETPTLTSRCKNIWICVWNRGVALHLAWTLKAPPVCNRHIAALSLRPLNANIRVLSLTVQQLVVQLLVHPSSSPTERFLLKHSYRDHRPVLVGYFNRDQRNSGKLVTDEVADEESIKTLDLQVGRKKICTEGYAVVWHAASFGLVRVSVSVTASNITVRWMCERLWDTELKSHWDSLFSSWLQADVTQPAGLFFHCLIVSFATFLIHYLLCFYMILLNLYLIYY